MEMQFRRWGLQGDSVEGQGGISLAILTEHAPGPELVSRGENKKTYMELSQPSLAV